MTTTLPEDMDVECVPLCKAMNVVPGIQTTESCCGHGKNAFRVWFCADNLQSLPPLLYWFDGCHCGHYGWKVTVYTDCAMSPCTFMAEGPIGEEGYSESRKIAELITQWHKKNRVQP